MWNLVLGGLSSLGKQWLENRKEKAQAKHIRQLSRIEADNTIAGNLTQGLKDEWWTLMLTYPYAYSYWAATFSPESLVHVDTMWSSLERVIDPQVWAVMTIISVVVSFGGRVTDVLNRFSLGKHQGNNSST